jgi:hypothetical protein
MRPSARKLYIESDGVKALVSPVKPKNAKGKNGPSKKARKGAHTKGAN